MKTYWDYKKNRRGQLLRTVFSVCIFLSMGVNASWAGMEVVADGINYQLNDDGTASVIEHPSYKYTGDVVILNVIPYKGKTYIVDRISKDAFYNCDEMTSISIPKTIKYIDSFAFYGCTKLEGVYITDIEAWCNIQYTDKIGYPYNPLYYAHRLFLNGTLVNDLVIPENVTSIGEFAFYGCWMNSITIPNSVVSIGDYAFIRSTLKSINIPSSVTKIGDGTFFACENLSSVSIPNSVTSIGNNAFEYCSGLSSIEIPDGVRHIGNRAFKDCDYLTSVVLPNQLDTIADYLFYGCYCLQSLELPDGITHIGSFAFFNCYKLSSISIPISLKSVGGCAFYHCRMESVYVRDLSAWCGIEFASYLYKDINFGYDTEYYRSNPLLAYDYIKTRLYVNGEEVRDLVIPEGTSQIKGNVFACYSGLESVTIPNSVKSIGVRAFRGCANLKKVIIGTGLEYIGEEAFISCVNLSEVDFGGTKDINSRAFEKCVSLKSLVLPDNLTNIGPNAFHYCDSLESVILPPNLRQIESFAFCDCRSLSSLTIPKSVTRISKSIVQNCTNLKSLKVEDGNPFYDSRGDCNAIIETSSNTLLAGFQNSIPEGVTSIADYAFYGMSMSDISIPYTVSYIGKFAFSHCKELSNLNLSNGVKIIDEYAFSYCNKLKKLVIPPNVENILLYAFYECNGLEDVYCFWSYPLPPIVNAIFLNSSRVTLHVPVAYYYFYETTAPWSYFKKIVPLNSDELMLDINGISNEDKYEIGRFTYDGQRVRNGYKGLVVIKYNDGTVKKIVGR